MVLLAQCQKQPSRAFPHAAIQNIFGNTGGKLLIINTSVTI